MYSWHTYPLEFGEIFILLFAVLKARVNILLSTAQSHGKGALIEFIFISPLEYIFVFMATSDLVIVIMIMIAIFRSICALLSANIWCDVQ